MADYAISEVPLRNGVLGIGPIPGRGGNYASDVSAILAWGADLVLTMNMAEELDYVGASQLGADLEAATVAWRHLPIGDMNAPSPEVAALWPEVSQRAHGILEDGGRVFVHCFGGCGRAGMISLRLMGETGEPPQDALLRLRATRPCAVENQAQFDWAATPGAA